MTDANPYTPPSSELNVAKVGENELSSAPNKVAFGASTAWIGEGFDYFKQSAGAWILTCIVGFFIMIALAAIPFVNFVSPFFTYVWVAGLLIGVSKQDQGENFKLEYLFAGFKHKLGTMVLLYVIVMVGSLAITIPVFGSIVFQLMSAQSPENMDFSGLAGAGVLALVLMIPLTMATVFVPPLVLFNDVDLGKAIKMSFSGCLKNIIPLFVFSILMTVLMIIGAIPLGLGLLVVFPLGYGAYYAAYKSIYLNQ